MNLPASASSGAPGGLEPPSSRGCAARHLPQPGFALGEDLGYGGRRRSPRGGPLRRAVLGRFAPRPPAGL